MELYAAVQPMVLTPEGYEMLYGEDDPEEVSLLQLQDKEVAATISGVLFDLYGLKTNLADPAEGEGLAGEIGTVEALQELKRLAAESLGKTVDDYQEGRVPAGYLFNHLINHADDSGYYLPVDFMQSFIVLDEISIGSAVALLRELDALQTVLEATYPDEMEAALAHDDEEELPEIAGPVGVWAALRLLCRSAIETGMPIHLG